ncbi:hypothetical protein [Mycobacterium sp. 852002-30065_SCH5024008]|uniref:hypothetical protein n=1 Tax=Mycobacterium sp. 852002-30065_SCH5024008 TaxID=1834088 RepID=UPI001E5A1A31|nr:hypothetical protein [Mycobacterium sp. 852002-30065_SCH5024008]
MASVGRGFVRAVARLSVVVGLVMTGGACTTHKHESTPSPATLTVAPTEMGGCAPDRLARCVPGLIDVEDNLFNRVNVYAPHSGFGAEPPFPGRGSTLEDCQRLPRLGATDKPELDVEYSPATDASGASLSNRFAANGADSVRIRFTVASDGDDVTGAMAAWSRRCPTWSVAHSMDNNGIQGWLVGESREALTQYQSGDTGRQWPSVVNMAATVLPNRVTVQAWYRTPDPSAASRNQILSQLIGAAGLPRPRSALPPMLADWSQAQISTLLPALSVDTGIETASGDNSILAGEPGSALWSLCPSGGHVAAPRYDPLASWQDFDQSKWDKPGKPPRPKVMISRAHAGDNFLADVRREADACAAHMAEKPAVCGDRQNRQSLQTDSAVAEGEDTVRLTQRWMRDIEVRGHGMCGEGVEALRVTQVRGLIVISSSSDGGWLFKGDTPPLPLSTLDELLAETVRRIKAA